MRFGAFPVAEAEGLLLAHAQRLASGRIAKGTRLTAEDVGRLEAEGVAAVVGARLEDGDLTEDEAAARIALGLAGEAVGAGPATTGRVNFFAGEAGLFAVSREGVDAFNAVDPALTLATLAPFARVEPGTMVATLKIIPLAVSAAVVAAALAVLRRRPVLGLLPFTPKRVALVQTELPSLKASVLDKTRGVLERRLEPSGSALVGEWRSPHETRALAETLGALAEADVVIVFGASAVIDADDVVPAAVRAAGGSVDHVGMPVDPGNLLLLGRLGAATLIGAPGCARSPKENGFDWVLDRILADQPVSAADIRGMGVGGLLAEIPTRPRPRAAEPDGEADEPDEAGVAVLVLAAGRSSRMNGPNKLLATFEGVPLVRRSVETALASRATGVTVVVGHQGDAIRAALAGLPVAFVENADFADGLSTSLRAGFAPSAETADGVLVMLADQPLLRPADLDAMIAAFRPAGEGSIVLATDGGRRANPVILSALYADAVAGLSGDVGARSIVAENAPFVAEVEIGRAASLDVDTPEAMAEAGGRLQPAF